jgi:hypothetical protein
MQTLAASWGHWHVLQYLHHKEGCDLPGASYDVCYYAAKQGNLEMLKWLYDNGYTLDLDEEDLHSIASVCHNNELMEWLVQHSDVQFTRFIMSGAAESGNSAMCEFLHAHGCPMHEDCCDEAAKASIIKHGNLDLLRWFREHGCPLNTDSLARTAASYNSVALIKYLQQDGAVYSSKQQLQSRKMLNIAGANGSLTTAKWLRQQGAEWPDILRLDSGRIQIPWCDNAVAWARVAGCASP